MTTAAEEPWISDQAHEAVDQTAPALPSHVLGGDASRGPRFGDSVWNLRAFVPRTWLAVQVDFSTIDDSITAQTAREYLYSRIHRTMPHGRIGGSSIRPLKITSLQSEFGRFKAVAETFRQLGAVRLSDVTAEHLQSALISWKATSPEVATARIVTLQHIYAHGAFLSHDRLTVTPWPGRAAKDVAGWTRAKENLTPRIPEDICAPMLKAAIFYVEKASRDILAARDELEVLDAAAESRAELRPGEAKQKLAAFIERRRLQGRGIPALDDMTARRDGVPKVSGVPQAPNFSLVAKMSGFSSNDPLRPVLAEAARQLGLEEGGLDSEMSPWPDTGLPWRPRLGPRSLNEETEYLRTACWITIAYLSGMRDVEVRELKPDCALTGTGEDGRLRYKLRGRVFKGRALTGEHAEWVVLEVVHQAVEVLRQLNDDPSHLFGYSKPWGYALMRDLPTKLNRFRQHLNGLLGTTEVPYIPNQKPIDGSPGQPWAFDTRQFRRTLAWHIAHQPFGVVAGARQYQHARATMFEGYAGTSSSGFAAEVEAEESLARMDYLEDLYRDWNEGARASGGAAQRIEAEFLRVRSELGDVPGVVANPARLRTMLRHLTTTLHPGVLNDCFYNAATAACRTRAKDLGRPLPLLNMCLGCSNSRRSSVHLPRLTLARNQSAELMLHAAETAPIPKLQNLALSNHIAQLDQLITEIE